MRLRDAIHVVVVRGSGRICFELRFSRGALFFAIMQVLLVVPATTGALLSGHRTIAAALTGPRLQRLSSSSFASGVHDALVSFARVPPPPRPYVPAVPKIEHEYPLKTPRARRGRLRVHSLHLKESISVKPFDARQRPDPESFAEISHLWRCRFTDHEAPIEPRLVRLLTTLNDIYDKPIHLISGHRTAYTVDTSPTSQHTIGTAADIRIPGVPVRSLQEVVKHLGARGVGLYAHQHFVHVDFRMSHKYFWKALPSDSEDDVMQAETDSAGAEGEDALAERPAASGEEDIVQAGADTAAGHEDASDTAAKAAADGRGFSKPSRPGPATASSVLADPARSG